MDYNGLTEQLRNAFPVDGYELERSVCESAADAIETLLAERDAAVADMRRMGCKKCDVCKHVGSKGSDESPCRHCCHGSGFDDYFEWRGLRGRQRKMREILFRGKRLDNGQWAYGAYGNHTSLDAMILDRPYPTSNGDLSALGSWVVGDVYDSLSLPGPQKEPAP